MSPSIAESIAELAPRMVSWRTADMSGRLAAELAQALGWGPGQVTPAQAWLPANGWFFAQGMVGAQPGVLIAAGHEPASRALVDVAASFAYQSSIEWGLATTPLESVAFNSHWIKDDDWFRLPPVSWEAPERNIDILEALSPSGLTSGRIDTVATSYYKPDKMLLPVDEALVRRLDSWRDEALRHAREIAQVDDKLQTLFAQFFVLRAIEDRGLAPDLPTLQTTLSPSGGLDVPRLESLFALARDRVQCQLFDQMVHSDFPGFLLAGIVHDLYVPYNLPARGFRYNFAWIGSGVLGTAYEKYLSTLLVPVPSHSPQLSLFEQPLREVERVSVRKQAGVYYTPDFLVGYLTQRALDHFYQSPENDRKLPRVADFTCGSGSFLTAAVDHLIGRLRSQEPDRNWGREIVDNKLVVGIDNDSRAVALARLSLWLRLAEEPDPLPLPRLHDSVVHGDSLSEVSFASIPATYDVILGNPPFIATGRFPSRAELAERFRTAQGRFDYAYPFVELAIRRLNSGGVLGMVVPNRLFQNRSAAMMRSVLLDSARLLTVVDFGSTQVFEGTSAYVGAIVARKAPAEPSEHLVRVLDVHRLPPRFAGPALLDADRRTTDVSTEYLEAFNVPHPADPSGWLLLSPGQREARLRLEEASQPLGSIAAVHQGIRTGANDIFIVELLSYSRGPLAEIRNGLGDVFPLEKDALHPVVFGSEVRRYEAVRPTRYLIYPYWANEALREAELRQRFPHTYLYLSHYQRFLTGRKSTAGSGLGWYELVRKRDERWLTSRKLLIRDLATGPAFALDDDGSVFLVGGTAVVPEDTSLLLPLLGYLNSSIADWYLRHMTPAFRSGFQKYEPQHLQVLPVPSQVIEPTPLSQELTDLVVRALQANSADSMDDQAACEHQIDLLLAESLGLNIPGVP